jgi:hypothetical protein
MLIHKFLYVSYVTALKRNVFDCLSRDNTSSADKTFIVSGKQISPKCYIKTTPPLNWLKPIHASSEVYSILYIKEIFIEVLVCPTAGQLKGIFLLLKNKRALSPWAWRMSGNKRSPQEQIDDLHNLIFT